MNKFTNADQPHVLMRWKVFPASVKKTPLLKGWRAQASSDLEVIKSWHQEFPKMQIAAATGPASNMWVIDIDVKDDRDGLTALEDHFGSITFSDQQLIAGTPSGGYHLYFQWDASLPVTTHVNVLDGIDIRGDGGLIMLPPSSVLKSDNTFGQYRWRDPKASPAPITTWARELALMALKRDDSSKKLESTSKPVDLNLVLTGLPAGKRNSELWRYTCHLRGKGISAETALAFMKAVASFCNPPYPEHEAIDMVRRAYELGNIKL